MIKFILNETEEVAAKEFEQQHMHPEVNKGAIGGHIHYIFTPTSIATACCIRCAICGEQKNITDYNCW